MAVMCSARWASQKLGGELLSWHSLCWPPSKTRPRHQGGDTGPSQLHRLLFSSLYWPVCGCPPAERNAWKSDLGSTLTKLHGSCALQRAEQGTFWDKQPSLMSPKGRLSPPQRNSHQPSGSVLLVDVAVGCEPQLGSQDVYLKDGFTLATHGPRDFKYCNSPWQP